MWRELLLPSGNRLGTPHLRPPYYIHIIRLPHHSIWELQDFTLNNLTFFKLTLNNIFFFSSSSYLSIPYGKTNQSNFKPFSFRLSVHHSSLFYMAVFISNWAIIWPFLTCWIVCVIIMVDPPPSFEAIQTHYKSAPPFHLG